MKGKMDKNTGVRNTYKKEPFFDGQVKKFDSGMVSWIETPNTHFGKNNIPNNKENCRQNYGQKNGFPSFYVLHPVFETIQKWNKKGSNI